MTRAPERPRLEMEAIVHPGDPSVTVARAELGATLYIADTSLWAHRGAAELAQTFFQLAPPSGLSWWRTSLSRWQPFQLSSVPDLVAELRRPPTERPRHLFEFEVTDDIEAGSCGFYYREVDRNRADRAGVIEITFPQEQPARTLSMLVSAAMEIGGLYGGVGGHCVRLSRHFTADAFDVAWGWTRRFRGLDIQDRDEMSWLVRDGLAGISWLNVIGDAWLETRPELSEGWASTRWDSSLSVRFIGDGLLVQAGGEPRLGDRHRGGALHAYLRAGERLGPYLVEPPLTFLGRFIEHSDPAHPDGSFEWFRRFCG